MASCRLTVKAEVVEGGMGGAVAAGQLVVSEAGDLQVASVQHHDGSGKQVEVESDGEKVVEPAESTHVVQQVVRQVDVAHVHVRTQRIYRRQTAASPAQFPHTAVQR